MTHHPVGTILGGGRIERVVAPGRTGAPRRAETLAEGAVGERAGQTGGGRDRGDEQRAAQAARPFGRQDFNAWIMV
jgi:hypothetical protein